MKILKTIILGTALMALFGTAGAAKFTRNVPPLSLEDVLKTYVEATTQGNVVGFEKILSNNVTFTTTRNDNVITLKKEDVLNNLKANAGIKQDCTTTTTLLTATRESTVYEIDVKYADYVRADYITIVGNDESGWKITKVNTTIK